jgi:hypothetical protein
MVEDAPTPRTPDTPKDDAGADSKQAAPAAPTVAPRRAGGLGLLVPALALLVGLVLGGTLVAVTRGDSDGTGGAGGGASAAPGAGSTSATASPTSTATSLVVNVPAACVQLADDAQVVRDLIDKAVAAARDLNATDLSALVPQMQQAQEKLSAQADACRAATNTSG